MLYHGSRIEELPNILKNGLEPRGSKEGNWESYPSHPELVYLSDAYPCYFAVSALCEAPVILLVEVEKTALDAENMRPDEDWVASQLLRHLTLDAQQRQETAKENIDLFADEWENCLRTVGTCAHRGVIPVSALTRYVTLDVKARPELAHTMLEPVIGLLNYKLMGDFYKQLVAWIFGDVAQLPQLDRKHLPAFTMLLNDQYRVFWTEQSADRSGIDVHIID